MTSPESARVTTVRPRVWSPMVTVVPYVLLGLLAGFTAFVRSGHDLRVDLGLSALAALWLLGMFTLRPAARERTTSMVVFFAGLLAIWAVLVVRAPWFGCFAPAAFFLVFRVLRWPWLIPGVAGAAAVAGTAQAASVDKSTTFGLLGYFAVLAANILPMCGYAWYAWRGARQNDVRDQALAEVSEANRRLEATLAENAVLHQRLLDQAREAGVLDERQRMAREIHDTLAQGLTGIITQLQATEDADRASWHKHVDAATQLARDSLREARRSVHALRPEPLNQTGLEAERLSEAVAGVAGRWSKLHGIEAEVTTTGTTRPLPADAEVALLRTAQEALANVAKHAKASRVGVTLSYLEDAVALDVRDDGQGIGQPSTSEGGFGLVAMRERIEALSGDLQIESEPGAGTAISARIPITGADR
ncbi:sensor histidine kinase [Kribbella monticola]|uniref:sensor histidine kinase n=1 Tax=Kribbella monticola TaxID=2185285 RepID=UPI0018E51737|nr:sensor histidine kinase [Kribbella monticola]